MYKNEKNINNIAYIARKEEVYFGFYYNERKIDS